MSISKSAGLAVALLGLAPGLALAQASSLQLILGGEAYDGPPKFEVSFNGKVLGESAVAAAIDTGTEGRLADAADKSAYVQTFAFEIPEADFQADGEVRVRLTNEAFGGEGSNRDRNLFLAAVVVNGKAVTASGLTTETQEGAKDNEMLGEFVMLKDGNEQGVSKAPNGGWPLPATAAVAVKTPDAQPAAEAAPVVAEAPPATSKPAVEAEIKPPVQVAAVVAPEPQVEAVDAGDQQPEAPVVAAIEPQPEATANATPTDSIETASLDGETAVAVDDECGLDQLYNVIGFNPNSNDLTPRLMERLDQIVEDIGGHKCTVLVTGYSSTQGAHATNALFAVERAQNVLAYLKTKGLQFKKVSATGAGATTQFGPDFASNRRVVITVLP